MGSLFSKSCALMDGDSGRILFGKNETEPKANASTTKILTCILALEFADIQSIVTSSKNAVKQPEVHLGMREGEQFYLKDLLYALMLESFNDCAVAIAEHMAGNVEAFSELMNEKAKEIGCKDTYFITPNGLDAENENGKHHTTAADLCLIMRYCVWESPKSEEFCGITQTDSYTFSDLEGKSFVVNNKNEFRNMVDGVLSGKTGFTADAGYCYIVAVESEGRKFCIALLACGWPNHKTYKWSDAKKILSYAKEYYTYRTMKLPEKFQTIQYTGARSDAATLDDWKKTVALEPYLDWEGVNTERLVASWESFSYEAVMYDNEKLPIFKDDIIGTLQCFLAGELMLEIPIRADKIIREWTFSDFLLAMINAYF